LTVLVGGGGKICGLTADGAAYCLGPTPWAVAEEWSFSALGATLEHMCGVAATGTAYCWGSNWYGQLGNGDSFFTSSPAPVAVTGDSSFTAVTAGGWHTCGLTGSGAAYCWGHGNDGELGDGTSNWSSSPLAVLGGLTFASLATGFLHTCGLTIAGAAYCWGDNHWGELGNSACETCESATPSAVSGGLSFVALASGWMHACGLTSDGVAYCWGNNESGQLGDGSSTQHSSPVRVTGGLTFGALAPGNQHTCGLTTTGVPYCWGDNGSGQLGNGSTRSSLIPVRVAPF
jgi:alpha-tubulin suppressor-like RCC1 family protein